MLGEVFVTYEKFESSDGYVREKWLNDCGLLHREGAPAYILYDDEHHIVCEEFCFNGEYHRDGGPAAIQYNKKGAIINERYSFRGKEHRDDGPAVTWYNDDGSIDFEVFIIHGKRLGNDKKGFWALWDSLTEEQRNNPEILKCLSRFL